MTIMIEKRSRAPRTFDLFAGVGGSSWGAQGAGARIVGAVDSWRLAKETYGDNFNGVRFYRRKCEWLDPKTVLREIGRVELLIASPECTSHTCAKGNAARSDESRETAFQVTRFARVMEPRWIVVENVLHMQNWDRYEEWLEKLERLGYSVRQQVLNAADFGVPQSRKRLFVICDSERMPPEIVPSPRTPQREAKHIVDLNGDYRFSALRKRRQAAPTLERAQRAISAIGRRKPFLLVYYGTDGGGGWQGIDRPLRTVTTLDRFAYVRPTANGHEMRMLQVPELQKAMGFPANYRLKRGTRRDRIKLLGNAVCPPVMEAIVRTITMGLKG